MRRGEDRAHVGCASADCITIDPDLGNGKPVVRGLRIMAETILDDLGAGRRPWNPLAAPMLEPEDSRACLAFASRLPRPNRSIREVAE